MWIRYWNLVNTQFSFEKQNRLSSLSLTACQFLQVSNAFTQNGVSSLSTSFLWNRPVCISLMQGTDFKSSLLDFLQFHQPSHIWPFYHHTFITTSLGELVQRLRMPSLDLLLFVLVLNWSYEVAFKKQKKERRPSFLLLTILFIFMFTQALPPVNLCLLPVLLNSLRTLCQ